jgi:AcrR family transcriptional regulator
MSPRTKQQFEEIRKTSKEKILKVALELFAKKGYHATSISQIAQKAKISKGLMYNYFKNKEKLLKTVVLEGFNKIMELDYGLNESVKPNEKLKNLIDEALDNLSENLQYWQLYTALLVQPHIQKKFENKFYEFRELFIASMVEIFRGLGCEDPEMDAFLLGMHFDGLALNFVASPDDFPMDEIKKALYDKYSNLKRKKKR